ncbi:hypothetical protein SAMD00019534_008060 [Acytostelium subglobosum LB1]|uniref:hypothetical protein n=1 Tax=Acytostelium subglobosum LB1 TaxID=1410327 RepID=UPI000644DED3|nr:hypothetical protein SAMD00019534_008060 [Acytostelium subglobosum LB1]GAM17631.1 hypothetical protein SAMD00019534_008060 [Acytostelium subglobosum LB1]|eukprot:XP_012758227.1 hypothetical protein SAMD00019534_008060 [Acytostelium subglobosum LB1]
MTFDLLRKHGVYLNDKKPQLCKTSVVYGGHILSGEGIKKLHSNVQAIMEMPIPSTVRELRAFLGACQHYAKFLDGCKDAFARLTSLVSNKFTRLKLSEEHRKDFQTIRTALCSDTCLIVPRKEVPLRVYTDASDFGTGLLIAQEDANVTPINHHIY